MKKAKQKLPKRLLIIRHAKSLPNEKLAEAEAAGADYFELPMPEHLAPIVPEGALQVCNLGAWLGQLPEEERPHKIVSSTHTRTRETSEGLVQASGLAIPVEFDERLTEKRWGVIGGLTKHGLRRHYPQEVERRRRLGDFRYPRIAGGESLRDLKKRIKPALAEQMARHEDENLAIVTHSQVILVLRQLLDGLTEKQALELDARSKIPNCSVCVYVRKGRRLVLEREYFVAPSANPACPTAA